jgi:small subunit ribosomal protein S6
MVKTVIKNTYEVNVVFKGNLSEDELEKNITQIESTIKSSGGAVSKIEDPLRRRFTHKMKGIKEGFYVNFIFTSPPELPNTLKRNLSISDDVLRYMVIRKEG